MATRPTIDDLVAWLKLMSTPDAEALAVYQEALDTALVDIESRIVFDFVPVATTYRRTLDDGVTTIGLPTISSASAAFTSALDVGRPIAGSIAAVPAATTILSVQSATAATMSANATASTTLNVFTINPASYPQKIRTAILMDASRLAKRSTSPEGTAGFGNDGAVMRILGNDPDVERLIRRFLKLDGFA